MRDIIKLQRNPATDLDSVVLDKLQVLIVDECLTIPGALMQVGISSSYYGYWLEIARNGDQSAKDLLEILEGFQDERLAKYQKKVAAGRDNKAIMDLTRFTVEYDAIIKERHGGNVKQKDNVLEVEDWS